MREPVNYGTSEIQDLLKRARYEIKELRQRNELMSAKLEVYETMKMMVNTIPSYPQSGMMHPDILDELKKADEALEMSSTKAN